MVFPGWGTVGCRIVPRSSSCSWEMDQQVFISLCTEWTEDCVRGEESLACEPNSEGLGLG